MEPQAPIAGAPGPPPQPATVAEIVRKLLHPDATSDIVLIVADALDEAALHLPMEEAAPHRRAARFLRDAAPYCAPPRGFVRREPSA